jgi:hypothetical protein
MVYELSVEYGSDELRFRAGIELDRHSYGSWTCDLPLACLSEESMTWMAYGMSKFLEGRLDA